jgi:hypothetical protein
MNASPITAAKPSELSTAERLRLFFGEESAIGIRTALISAYTIGESFYSTIPSSAAHKLSTLGQVLYYALEMGHMGRSKRKPMNVDILVANWHKMVVGLATAHDKDDADRYEAAVEECLTPILAAPIKQIREFYPKLLVSLKADPSVPFLVWRAYEVWIEMVLKHCPDEGIKELKTALAQEIAGLVEQDVKDQIPQALVRALQWRSAETLAEVKQVVEREKAAGRNVRLRGRESCLFLECGGTSEQPEVCVQI